MAQNNYYFIDDDSAEGCGFLGCIVLLLALMPGLLLTIGLNKLVALGIGGAIVCLVVFSVIVNVIFMGIAGADNNKHAKDYTIFYGIICFLMGLIVFDGGKAGMLSEFLHSLDSKEYKGLLQTLPISGMAVAIGLIILLVVLVAGVIVYHRIKDK